MVHVSLSQNFLVPVPKSTVRLQLVSPLLSSPPHHLTSLQPVIILAVRRALLVSFCREELAQIPLQPCSASGRLQESQWFCGCIICVTTYNSYYITSYSYPSFSYLSPSWVFTPKLETTAGLAERHQGKYSPQTWDRQSSIQTGKKTSHTTVYFIVFKLLMLCM